MVVPPDLGQISTREIMDSENDFEPEAKRLKSVSTDDRCRAPQETPSWPRQSKAPAQAATPPLPGKGWQCGFCTYINNSVLPYCEMCENPPGHAGEYTERAGSGVSENLCF